MTAPNASASGPESLDAAFASAFANVASAARSLDPVRKTCPPITAIRNRFRINETGNAARRQLVVPWVKSLMVFTLLGQHTNRCRLEHRDDVDRLRTRRLHPTNENSNSHRERATGRKAPAPVTQGTCP